MQKKNYITLFAIVIGVVTAIAYLLQNRKRQEDQVAVDAEEFPIDKAGFPGTENNEDSKMVDEGAQFGVQYYNHVTEEGEVVHPGEDQAE